MRMTRKMTGSACLAIALMVASATQAQTAPAATSKMSATPATPAPHGETVDALFARWDKNHDKVLSVGEFRAGWQELQTTVAVRRLHEQFVAMDTNKNDCLDAAEYANLELVKKAGKSAPPMATFDTNKNGCLDFKEYVGMVEAMLKTSADTNRGTVK